jgi:hypothetical protein
VVRLRRTLTTDVNDVPLAVVLPWMVITGLAAIAIGALGVTGVIPLPVWIGVCSIVGGAMVLETARFASRRLRHQSREH